MQAQHELTGPELTAGAARALASQTTPSSVPNLGALSSQQSQPPEAEPLLQEPLLPHYDCPSAGRSAGGRFETMGEGANKSCYAAKK